MTLDDLAIRYTLDQGRGPMKILWHHSRQTKAEGPVTFSELRRMARQGRLEANDFIRQQGEPNWIAASKVSGLGARRRPRWYYTHWDRTFGPVTGTQLRHLAAAGMIEPTDMVWRQGFERWKKARRLAGLFPASGPAAMSIPVSTDPRSRPPARHVPLPGEQRPRIREARPDRHSHAATTAEAGTHARRHLAAVAGGLIISLALIAAPAVAPRKKTEVAAPKVTKVPPSAEAEPTTDPGHREMRLVPYASPARPVVTSSPEPATPTAVAMPPAPRPIGERQVTATRPVRTASPLVDRINAAAEPLLKARGRKERDYRFQVLDSDDVDVCSLEDGTVYVSRGVFQLISNDVELAWLVGHEIAHAELRHGATAPSKDGHVPSTDQEHDADEWVTRRLLSLGHSRRECLSFLRRYRNYLQTTSAEKSDSASVSGVIKHHWHDRPAPATRIGRLEALGPVPETTTTASRNAGPGQPSAGSLLPSGEDSSRLE
jgi:hypothetical protein